jgi:phenylalanyl-tRNA synthetase beta chain
VVAGFGIEGEFFVAELLADVLFQHCEEAPVYRPVGRFPNVKVDIALVVDEGLEARLVEDEIERNGGEHLRSVRLFDVYRGQQVPSGRKSLAFALEFESEERTLTDEEAHLVMGAIIDAVERSFGAVLRGRRPLSEGEA